MYEDKYFFEIWLKGYAKKYSRELSEGINTRDSSKKYYPHITLIPPFSCDDEESLLSRFKEKSNNVGILPFNLENFNYFSFEGKNYFHLECQVKNGIEDYRHNLHVALEDIIVCGAENKEVGSHNHHVTIAQSSEEIFSKLISEYNSKSNQIQQYMLRVTLLKKRSEDEEYKVLNQYDFVTNTLLSREEALDRDKWKKTIIEFTRKTNLVPSKNGFIYQ